MGCRCADIQKCQREISVLSGEVSRYIGEALRDNSSITPLLNQSAACLREAVFLKNEDDTTQKLVEANRKQDTALPSLQSRCSGELSKLRSRLSQWQSEDQQYHREQEAKRQTQLDKAKKK